MKPFILFVLAFSVFTISKAQITKGSTMIGGSMGYNNSNSSNFDSLTYKSTYNYFNFGVSYAKCFKENTFWGITGSFAYSDNTNSDNGQLPNSSSSQSRTFSIGIFERKYYPLIKNLFAFGQAGLNYSFNNSDNGNTLKGYRISATAFPGISYKASKKIYLETTVNNLISIGYAHSESTMGSNIYKTNNFTSNIQLPTQILQNLNVGMTIILGK